MTAPIETTYVSSGAVSRGQTVTYGGHIVAVFGAKAGVGSTTIAANLARALAMVHSQARVLLCDMAPLASPVGAVFGTRPGASISDFALVANAPPEELRPLFVEARDGVWLIGFASHTDQGAFARAVGALSLLRRYFDYTVIDCRHQLDTHTISVLDAADRILLLTEQKVPALRAAQKTLNIFGRLSYSLDKLCLILNRYEQEMFLTLSAAAEVLKTDIFHKLPRDNEAIAQAERQRSLVVEVLPEPTLARELIHLARKLPPPGHDDTPRSAARQQFLEVFSRKRA